MAAENLQESSSGVGLARRITELMVVGTGRTSDASICVRLRMRVRWAGLRM